jgi:putative addiction module component (TIGR02574 family)
MTMEDVRALPVERKIQIMEAIWEDFRERFERSEISPQQKQLLDRRRARVREGAARLLDWDSVKGTLGRL